MTEVEKMFRDDIREKKSIKNSASKKNRTGKGPVKFPSDYLSKKEKEALNGECSTWNLNGFYTWDEFKKMPDDIKISWLNRMLNVYGIGISNIEAVVFDGRKKILSNWLDDHPEIRMYVNVPSRGGRRSKTTVEKFAAAVEAWRNPEPKKVENTTINPDETESTEPVLIKTDPNSRALSEWLKETDDSDISPTHVCYAFDPAILPKMSSMEFSMDGFDMDFLRMIRDRFGDQKVHVCVSVYVEKDMYGDSHE